MPKRMILMRHGKSSWETNTADFDRPLNPRGQRDSPKMAEYLIQADWQPDFAIYSTAARTTQTWELMQGTFADSIDSIGVEELYLATPTTILQTIAQLGDHICLPIIIGHNPGMELAVSHLARNSLTMTTANMALLACEAETWVDALDERGKWNLIDFVRPKEQ